ncbi:enoyl-ACP reductase FabV [Clostridium sp. 'White wine YQ']|uniref:enoyl-ACP reductase FabV n=1 Tax=Clostridium sp. 'White wine YQ' TaxID=3027474 RepID=UPI0023673A98|nr:enoyl-ACP reductase FabV [Clostridium sp. 'White wine YQ']MDD7792867.1 trans-2-enoyl-CoA reductase family protein [Clostridium sp. 'White wine YQ']
MKIEPKFRGFICTAAHPLGCEENVKEQIEYVKEKGTVNGAKNVLVIGASTGYGLSSRIVSAFGAGANTLAVSFEKESNGKRTATPGWYNTKAFEKFAKELGGFHKSINGDAFSDEIKEQVINEIKSNMGKVDLIIYSLASPRRTDPKTGEVYSSVIKTIGENFSGNTFDFLTFKISNVEVTAATEKEIHDTVKVMGGEDWKLWIEALKEADVLDTGVKTLAYSYIGPKLTYPMYNDGTIGMAKKDLDIKAKEINELLSEVDGKAYVSVNKGLVTQASSAIPIVPLYISVLYKVMKEKGIHEGCIEQIYRLFSDRIYGGDLQLDSEGRIRIDDLELRDDVQKEVIERWEKINSENITEISDAEGFREEFLKLFGFGLKNIDYDKDVEI